MVSLGMTTATDFARLELLAGHVGQRVVRVDPVYEALVLHGTTATAESPSHRAHRHLVVEDVPASLIHDLVHESNEVGSLVGLLVLLCEVFNRIVYKLLQTGGRRSILHIFSVVIV